jgi:hypothetical protein
MMQKRSVLKAIGLCFGAFFVATVGLQGKPPVQAPDWPLNMDLQNDPADGVRSDGASLWCQQAPMLGIQYCSGQQNVRAVIQATGSPGNLLLDTNNIDSVNGPRRLHLDFGAANSILDDRYPFGTTTFAIDTYIATLGENLNSTDPSLMTMSVNDVVKKRMRITWVNGNRQYNLRWDGSSGRGFVDFTCWLGSPCSVWKAEPALPAGLYSFPTKGKPTEAYYGEYAMPFLMTLVSQP